MTPQEFLAGCAVRNIAVQFDGFTNRLLVSPKSALTDTDTAFIRKHREQIVSALVAAAPRVKTEFCSICPGACPGGDSVQCAGCPQEEYRDATGLIYSAWCRDGRDVGQPVEMRERGTDVWRQL